MAGKIQSGNKAGFDPAAHLEKQGWKGKGTALKHGHAVRPLATVQKKTLSGIGKDRDLAVPFWDQIFASTAASLSLPGSGASSPAASPAPLSSSAAHATTLSWATLAPHGSPVPAPPPVQKTPGLSIQVRAGREVARRGLYGRFYRGAVLKHEEVEEEEVEEVKAGPSTLPHQELESDGAKSKEEGKENKAKKEKKGKKDKKESENSGDAKEGWKKRRRQDIQEDDPSTLPEDKLEKRSKKRRKEVGHKETQDREEPRRAKLEPAESKEERRARRKEKKRLKEAISAAT